MPDEKGIRLIDHYQVLIDQGRDIPDACLPDLPDVVYHIWEWWNSMNAERPSSGMGISPLSTKFMVDYLSAYEIKPMTLEVRLLKAIEQEFMESVYGRSKSTNKS